jgi:hypothetical protein
MLPPGAFAVAVGIAVLVLIVVVSLRGPRGRRRQAGDGGPIFPLVYDDDDDGGAGASDGK